MHPSPGHVFERRVFHVEHTVTDEPTTAVGCALAPEPQFTENTVAVGRGSPTLVDVGRFGHTSAGAVRSGSGGRRGGARSTLAAHSLRGIDDASATRRPPNGRTLIGDERSHRKSGSVVCPPPGSRD